MKQLITTLSIMLSLLVFSTDSQAQMVEVEDIPTVEIKNAPANLTKDKFKEILRSNGISPKDAKKIKGFKKMINSLHKENGKSVIQSTVVALKQMEKLSNGNIRVLVGDEVISIEMTPYD